MYNFYLPNFYEAKFQSLNLFFIDLLKERPNLFYDKIRVGSVYGNFPGMIWNGGRCLEGEPTLKEIISTIEIFNKRNIPIRFTCTNGLVQSCHLLDKFANTCLSLADNGMNEIIVNSSILEEYLREKYPNFKYISSTTKCLLNKEKIKEEGKTYYLTVLDYRYNKNIDFLKTLNPSQYELLLNPYCGIKCPCRSEHYNLISQIELGEKIENVDELLNGCQYIDGFFEALKKSEGLIKVEELYSTYSDMGFKDFKIEGRKNSITDVLESYLYYMVKPEKKDYVRYLTFKYAFEQIYN